MLVGLPEHRVPLPPEGGHPSQTDIWVLARGRDGLVSIAVEGKVAEPFGPTVAEWLEDGSKGKSERLKFICDQLALDNVPRQVRYQLLHRTVSAVLEAKRFTAGHALMLVQSFSQQDEGFADYGEFVRSFNAMPVINGVVGSVRDIGVKLYFGWVREEDRYLKV